MAIRRRGNKLVIDYYPQGRHTRKRITLPENIQDEDEARKIEEELKKAIQDPAEMNLPTGAIVKKVFPEYLDWYELHRQKTTLDDISEVYKNHLKPHLGSYKIADITINHINVYKRLRKSEAILKNAGKKKNLHIVSNRTINKELSYFSGFLKWCRVERSMNLKKITFDKLPYKRPIPIILSFDEVIRMIKASNPFYRALFLCLYCSGLRSMEARMLRIEDVDFENRSLKVIQKGGSEKIVPVPQLLLDCIKEIKTSRRQGYLFIHPRTQKPVVDIRRPLERARDAAGVIKKVTPHLLRHSIATHLLGKDVNLRTIQQFLGHSQIMTTEFYTHVDISHLRSASEAALSGLPITLGDYKKPKNKRALKKGDWKGKKSKTSK